LHVQGERTSRREAARCCSAGLDFSDDLAQPPAIRVVLGGGAEKVLTSPLREKPLAFGR